MKISKKNIKLWKANSPAGFDAWLQDVTPRILHRNSQYKIFKPTPSQDTTINEVLSSKNGKFQRSMSIEIQPRRHGKSTVFALICLWLFTSRRNLTIQLLGNTEQHCRRTQFNTLEKIIRNTPILSSSILESDIRQYSILFPALSNVIQMSAQNIASSFGEKISVLWCSDLHACADMQPFNALQASLLDSADSLLLIDSNVDFDGGVVHSLQQEAETDPTIYCNHVYYKDLDDYLNRAPAWIDRSKAKRLQRTTLPADWRRDLLGLRSDVKNSLFPSEVIDLCKSPYKTPVADINEITKGRAYKVGGGLDRSKSLFQGPKGDATVWTTILKVASPEHGEPEFFILNQQKINPNTSRGIKKTILKDNERYKLNNVVLENFEVGDLSPWMADMKIQHELVNPTDSAQGSSFPDYNRLCREGRFNFSQDLKELEFEMKTFSYIQRAGGKYSFGHSSQKYHDDHVYSVNWAIFSLRSAVMNLYSLGNVQCTNRTPKRHLCHLFGGTLVLLCARDCYSHDKVEQMFREYKQYQFDSEMTIQEFFQIKVKLEGARISQAV